MNHKLNEICSTNNSFPYVIHYPTPPLQVQYNSHVTKCNISRLFKFGIICIYVVYRKSFCFSNITQYSNKIRLFLSWKSQIYNWDNQIKQFPLLICKWQSILYRQHLVRRQNKRKFSEMSEYFTTKICHWSWKVLKIEQKRNESQSL